MKKAANKKKNLKLRKRIRRTVATVLMVTSLVVAAIPVPENLADNGGTGVSPRIVGREVSDYTYAENSGSKVSNIGGTINLDGSTILAGDIEKAYTVVQSGGEYVYQWQFEYYLQPEPSSGSNMAVIKNYNAAYGVQTVKIGNTVYTDFVVVTKADYDAFIADYVNTRKVSIGNPADTGNSARIDGYLQDSAQPSVGGPLKPLISVYSLDILQKYFPDEYKAYKDEYEKWEREGRDPATKPADLEKELREIAPARLTELFCDVSSPANDEGERTLNTLMQGFELKLVLNQQSEAEGGSRDVYMAQKKDENTQVPQNLFADEGSYNFLCMGRSAGGVIAIGNEAFKGTRNVRTLIMPEATKYVGDSAFESSFITDFTATQLEAIGNQAFKGCSALQSIDVTGISGISLQKIGMEAFYGSNLPDFEVPTSVEIIGDAAFANCNRFAKLSFAAGSHSPCEIGEYAFYNASSLTTVDWGEASTAIKKLGEGAFAITSDVGSMTEFTFPHGSSSNDRDTWLGGYLLAGRGLLTSAHIPAGWWGRSTPKVTLPENTFVNCYGLGYLEFVDDGAYSCGYIAFGDDLFAEVTNPDLYVRGPKLNNSADAAWPRQSTWEAHSVASTEAGTGIPYVYKEGGKDYYEIYKDPYLQVIDGDGVLQSCSFKDGSAPARTPIIIPNKVGNITVKEIASGSFDNDNIKEYITSITIEDGSEIKTIADNVFKGCPLVDEIHIGDSVETIGNGAFSDCGATAGDVHVYFSTPSAGYEKFKMGTDAFTTGGQPLTFHADAVKGYAPFDYAVAEDTYANRTSGLRICFRSLAPENIVIMRDDGTGLVTLVDYPHYDELNAKNSDYIATMEKYWTDYYSGSQGDALRQAYIDQREAGTSASDLEDTEYNGPWNNGQSVTISGTSETLPNYFRNHAYDLKEYYENAAPASQPWKTLSPDGLALVESTLHLVVPKGVESIDGAAYYTDTTHNGINISRYLSLTPAGVASPSSRYMDKGLSSNEDVTQGLFSSYMADDHPDKQEQVKGNDYIKSVTLYDVQYLPDYAFDSCEALEAVSIGDACTDIGEAPFRGCSDLSSMGGNDIFLGENGIVYSVNQDGTYTIEECLPARGNLVGERLIRADNDPYLSKVSKINNGAFEGCNYVSKVFLEDCKLIDTIPENCFRNSSMLNEVSLPDTVTSILENAFTGDHNISVTIPGREVFIAANAFDHSDPLENVTIRTYADSAAANYANYYEPIFLELIEESYKVTFVDHDGKEIDVQYVTSGGSATPPANPTRTGYTFKGWSGEYTNITADTLLIAQYEANENGGNGGNNGGDNGGNNGGDNGGNNGGNNGNNGSSSDDDDDDDDDDIHRVTVVNGMGSGRYKKGRTVTITANSAPTGQTFSQWVTESENVAFANAQNASTTFTMPKNSVTVTATYKESDTGNSVTYSTTKSPSVAASDTGTTTGGADTGSGTGGGTGGTGGSGDGTSAAPAAEGSNTSVVITKGGISNTDKASAVVNGSNDNFVVRITEDSAATAAVEEALEKEYGSLEPIVYSAMDISLYDATGAVKIADTSGLSVDVTMPIPDSLVSYAGNNKAGAVVDNNTLEKLNARFNTIDGVPCISFTATHFSPYTIYVDTNNLTAAMDTSPQTGDAIHPKWFLAIGLACLSVVLFLKRDTKAVIKPV